MQKKNEKFDQRNKGFKPSHFRNQQRQPSQVVTKPTRMMGDKPRDPKEPREPIQCWGCGGDHMIKYCPHRNGNEGQIQSTQGVETVGQEPGPFIESTKH